MIFLQTELWNQSDPMEMESPPSNKYRQISPRRFKKIYFAYQLPQIANVSQILLGLAVLLQWKIFYIFYILRLKEVHRESQNGLG